MTTNDATNQHDRSKQRSSAAEQKFLRLVQMAEAELVERLEELSDGFLTPFAIETGIHTASESAITTLHLSYGAPTRWIDIDHYLYKAWFSTTATAYKDGQSEEIRVELSEEQLDQLTMNFWVPRIDFHRFQVVRGATLSSDYDSPGKDDLPF
jgi:hypothetical protein